MSKDVDRARVFQTTRVRTALKNDVSWIHKSKQENGAQDKASTDQAAETKPPPVRQKSYVLSTARRFEDSATLTNDEAILPQNHSQPEGSTAKTRDDIKPQALTKEPIQNGEPQPEKTEGNKSAENEGEHADTTTDQSKVDKNEAKVSADVHVEEAAVETSAVQPAEEKSLEQAAEEIVEVVIEAAVESTSDKTDVINETPREKAALPNSVEPVPGVLAEPISKSPTQPAAETATEGSCDKGPSEHAAGQIIEVAADVALESSPETPTMTVAAEEVVHQVPDLVGDTATESPAQPAAESVTEGCCEKGPSERASKETAEVVAEVAEDSTPETPTAAEEVVHQVPDLVGYTVRESPPQPAAETATEGSCEKGLSEPAAGQIVEAVADVAVESSPETRAVTVATAEETAPQDSVEPVPDVLAEPTSESPTEPAAETATDRSCEKEQAAEQIVEVAADVALESSPETPAVTVAAGEEAALQDSMEPVPDLVADTTPESLPQPAAEIVAEPAECKVESTVSAEPASKTSAEQAFESEVQPVINTVVEQSVEPTPESAADRMVELNIKDAVEPESDKSIELTDALDVVPPTTDTYPELLKDPKPAETEEAKLNQQSDNTNIPERPVEEPRSTPTLNGTSVSPAVCSICDKTIDGNIKITFSEPAVICHPDCLKCGVCAKALGDMLTPMFLHNQVIQCDGCFAKALKT